LHTLPLRLRTDFLCRLAFLARSILVPISFNGDRPAFVWSRLTHT